MIGLRRYVTFLTLRKGEKKLFHVTPVNRSEPNRQILPNAKCDIEKTASVESYFLIELVNTSVRFANSNVAYSSYYVTHFHGIFLLLAGRLSSRQKSQDQQPQQQQQFPGGHHYNRENAGEEPWNPGMLGSDPPRDSGRRLHQQLSGLSSSNSSDDEDAINSDATFTGSEVALARDSTLVLPSRRK